VLFIPLTAWTLLDGLQEGDLTCKKLGVGLLVVTIWLELFTSNSSQLSPPLLSLAPIKSANPGSPGKMAAKMEKERDYGLVRVPQRENFSGSLQRDILQATCPSW